MKALSFITSNLTGLRITIALSAVCAFVTTRGATLDGLAGEKLMEAVARESRPASVITSIAGEGGVWTAFRDLYADSLGRVPDFYSADRFPLLKDGVEGCRDLITDPIVSPSWWAADNHDYGDALRYDLYNILPCNADVAIHKRDFPPGNVVIADYTNGFWSAGRGYIGSTEVNFYSPPRGLEGDFARAVFYMITVYPCSRWSGLALNFCSPARYPGLQPHARLQLLAWHRADPVGDLERRRNDIACRLQGNRNPFVDTPDLIDYLWGDRAGESYQPGGSLPEPDSPAPLRAVYSLATDSVINLVSPYIPANAVWTVDGKPVSSPTLAVADLGEGKHELTFTVAGGVRGKLLISIVP